MTRPIRLVMAIHIHQPVGNFDGVFEDALSDSYTPFLDVLDDYPTLPIALHISGSLMEWLVKSHPDYIDRVRVFVERGQIEILGGAFYEPILAGIPQRDRIGQIALFSRYLEQHFGASVRGMWMPERVWEQSFADDLCTAGIEYTFLDDYHFKNAGFTDEQLHGYYLTEDEGKLLKVFPGSERLRYTIPFADPDETINYLRDIAERSPDAVVTFGDDGEKFGTWPETKKHVSEDGWLRRFFDALTHNADWLKVTTPSEAVDHISPLGKCYLPDSSYREMTEWALPTEQQIALKRLEERKKNEPDWNEIKPFLRGGFWRNFRVKYPEANEMYARMMQVSRRLEEAMNGSSMKHHLDLVGQARSELYRAQCNCSYWHGAFGGLYLPHLRNAVYRHLISADTLLEQASGKTTPWVEINADDYNLDARKEIRLAGDRLIAFLSPGQGGHLYEFDIRGTKHNLLATLNRRPEPYHETVREAGRRQRENPDGNGHHGEDAASIHDRIAFKQPDLDLKLQYDDWPRKSLVDHFFSPGLELETFQTGEGEIGDFVTGVYETRIRRSDDRVEAVLSREGQAGEHRIRIIKTVALDVASAGTLDMTYELENLPPGETLHFGVEFNFAGMAAGQPDRYYYAADGRQLGQLESIQDLKQSMRIGLIDEWLGLDATVETSQPADIWTFPIETISQSEGGFESVHQSCMVIPHWEFVVPAEGRWSVNLMLGVDTSVAQARQLREPAAIG
jgi:alpha-amylase/alpha-mannosidase (GH57 family)